MESRETREKIHFNHKLGFAAMGDNSPKWENHKFSTPKNNIRTAKNPFEPLLHEVMHTNIMSPSVFVALPNKGPIAEDEFCWSIEELAALHPIDIEKSPFTQTEATDHVLEAVAQAKINKFFSAKTILPSPAGPTPLNKPLVSMSGNSNYPMSPLAITPSPPPHACTSLSSNDRTSSEQAETTSNQQRRKVYVSTATQTYLSLPAVLPAALENLLRSYMQADGKLMGALYPSGYSSGEDEDADNQSPPKTINYLSPLAESPTAYKPLQDRFSDGGSPYNDHRSKDNWQLSPIAQDDEDSGGSGTSVEQCMMRSRRSVAKLDFSVGHMSVDLSNPPQMCGRSDDDLLNGLSFHNDMAHLGTTPRKKPVFSQCSSPTEDLLSANTSVNGSSFCRMEDDYVTFHRSRSLLRASPCVSNQEMDISFSNTPKSRSASATRRRLCDSFASFGDEDDDEDHELEEPKEEESGNRDEMKVKDDCDDTVGSGSLKKYKLDDNLIRKCAEISSITDAGYSTASGNFEENSLCFEKNTQVFASTPTKAKVPFYPNKA